MPAIARLARFLLGFFWTAITSPKTSPDPVAGIEQDGALIPGGALLAAIGALQTNAAPSYGNWGQSIIPASLPAATYNAQQMVQGFIRRFGNIAQDSTDTATNIINAIPGAKPQQTWLTVIANMGSNALNIGPGVGVTMTGTAIVGGFSARLFLGQVTGSAAATFTGLFSLPLSSGL